MTNSRSDPVCSHYQSQCLVRFPYCGKFFPRHRCHNESNCTEDQARAVNATPIRCTICFSLTFYLFFLLNFFLLPKKMAILKMYLLVNLLTPKGFEKTSLNWDFFTLFIGCIQWLSNSTLLSQGSQRLCNWNDTKWGVSTFVETSCNHWTPPGCPRVDHPIARYHWLRKLLSTKIT